MSNVKNKLKLLYNRDMNKNIFKKFLLILDQLEIHNLSDEQVIKLVSDQIVETYPTVSLSRCETWYEECLKCRSIKKRVDGFDLAQAFTLFAKSKDNSELEALALFESCVRIKENRLIIEKMLDKKFEKDDAHDKDLPHPPRRGGGQPLPCGPRAI